MKHYYHPMSRAVTTDWLLRELDAEHEQVLVDFPAGENQTPDFLAINPMGKIPTLVDDGVVVTEAAAICAYLADKYLDKGLAPAPGTPLRGSYYRYLFYPGTALEPMFTLDAMANIELSPQSVGWGDRDRCLHTIEEMTPEKDWALGTDFSAADIVFGGTLDFAIHFGWLPEPSAKVAGYVTRLKARPAYLASHDSSWH